MFEQLPLFVPDSDWTPPSHLPDRLEGKVIGLDTETRDPLIKSWGPGWAIGEGYVVGVSIAADNWKGYLPIRHERGPNLDARIVKQWLNKVLSDPNQGKVGANVGYDLGWLDREGVTVQGPLYDVAYACALLDEDRMSYSLDAMGKHDLNRTKDERLLREAAAAFGYGKAIKDNLWRLPPAHVGPYAEEDAVLARDLLLEYTPRMEREDLWDLFANTECALIRPLMKMRKKGVRVDLDRAAQLAKRFGTEFADIVHEIRRRWGYAPEVWSSESLSVLFDKAGVEYPKTLAGKPSFQAAWLSAQSSDVAQMVLRARRLDKMKSSFAESMIAGHAKNGRIHCEFHPLRSDDGGTVSGRFSSSNPNLQQVPSRDEERAPLVRGCFIPEDGCRWGQFDYSEQEPRTLVHFASLVNAKGAEEAVRYYRDNPKASFHTFVSELTGMERKKAKIINLGLFYAMGGVKLCRSLGLPVVVRETRNGGTYEAPGPEAIEILEQYNEKLPFVSAMQELTKDLVERRGYIKTLLKRRARFNLWEPASMRQTKLGLPKWKAEKTWPGVPLKRAFMHKALNRLVQGSSADMMKRAIIEVDRAGYTPHLTVHDELDDSIENERQGREITEIMKTCVNLVVPLRVDAEYGSDWGHVSEAWDGQ